MTETLLLGTTDIGKYVIRPNTDPNEYNALEKSVKQLRKRDLPQEKSVLSSLESDLLDRKMMSLGYASLDPDFLLMNNQSKVSINTGDFRSQENTISVPKFGVFPFYDQNSTCEIVLAYSSYNGGLSNVQIRVNDPSQKSYDYNWHMSQNDSVPDIKGGLLQRKLIESLGFNKDSYIKALDFFKSVFSIADSRGFSDSKLTLTTSFKGIIPDQILEEVKKSRKHFDKKELYLVSEVDPKAWTITAGITSDPLVVGVKGERCYLVYHFNTTPLEDFVRNEFLR
jgi:hypothetical protein